jgi:hypothetical protein
MSLVAAGWFRSYSDWRQTKSTSELPVNVAVRFCRQRRRVYASVSVRVESVAAIESIQCSTVKSRKSWLQWVCCNIHVKWEMNREPISDYGLQDCNRSIYRLWLQWKLVAYCTLYLLLSCLVSDAPGFGLALCYVSLFLAYWFWDQALSFVQGNMHRGISPCALCCIPKWVQVRCPWESSRSDW